MKITNCKDTLSNFTPIVFLSPVKPKLVAEIND